MLEVEAWITADDFSGISWKPLNFVGLVVRKMAFRLAIVVTELLILVDLVCTALRPTWKDDDDVRTFLFLSGHAAAVILEGVAVFAFFSATVWFEAGLLGELMHTVYSTMPLFVARLFLVQMPIVYWKYVSRGKPHAWDDGVYVFLYVMDIVVACAFWVSLVYTMSCMTDKRMYAPYHRERALQRTTAAAMGVVPTEQPPAEMTNRGVSPVNGGPPPATFQY